MTKNRIIYALFAVLCLLFSAAYKSNFSAVLLITVLMYLPIAAILTAVSLLLCGVEFVSENYVGEKGNTFEAELEVKNRFVIPFLPIELLCVLPDGERGVFAERRIFVSLQPFGKTTLSIKCRHRYRGSYKSNISRIYIVDPLGIIRFSRKINKEMTMIFLPRRFTLEDLFERSGGETVVSRRAAKSADREDFSHVRGYRDGDILQLVHWKLTAKSDDIMIKEYESVSGRKAKILCDIKGCAEKRDIMLYADTVIETTLAFAKSLLNANIGVTVDYGDIFRRNITTVRNNAEYEHLFELMSTLPADAEACDLDSMLSGIRIGEQSIIVLISTTVTEKTVFMANCAASMGAVILAYINLDDDPLTRDYSKEKFRLMNIRGTDKAALNDAADAFHRAFE